MSAEARGADGRPVPGIVAPPDPVAVSSTRAEDLRASFTLPARQAAASAPSQLVFALRAWQAQATSAAGDDWGPGGDLTWTVRLNADGAQENQLAATAATVRALDRAASPCADPCAPRRTGRTPVGDCGEPGDPYGDPYAVLPWLHTDPVRSTGAGDPKALALAALGAWLAEMTARDRVGAANEVNSSRRQVAQGIYQAAWLLLFGVNRRADPGARTNAASPPGALVRRAAVEGPHAAAIRTVYKAARSSKAEHPVGRSVRRPPQ